MFFGYSNKMIKLASWLSLMLLLLSSTVSGIVIAQTTEKLPATDENVTAGKQIYRDRCWYCHGKVGDGNGPAADFLDPRPRDFTAGMYKIRTTKTGELPTDEDLFRIDRKSVV